jgi:phenylalanyl-tRNA synthetase alpha chain
MNDDLASLRAELVGAVQAAADLKALDDLRVAALGKNGRVTALMKTLGGLDPEARKARGAGLNELRDAVAATLDARKAALEAAALEARLAGERIDVTLPVRPEPRGRIHPLSQCLEEATAIFGEMGFVIAEGPEIETDWHNFTALNTPPNHPARQMQDTFYMAGRDPKSVPEDKIRVLRTHTSPVQVRTMLAQKPPIRIVAPGRVYRVDYDATHSPMFHQIEGLVIGEDIHMGHLKGCLTEFCRAYFESDDVTLRFRPSYFPFTEPSAEIDIGCSKKGGELRFGGTEDWMEILGSGMVHPNVLRMCGIDPERYQGFAFGMGLDRIAMLKYGIPDSRNYFESDLRWIRHYGFVPLDVPSVVGGLGS